MEKKGSDSSLVMLWIEEPQGYGDFLSLVLDGVVLLQTDPVHNLMAPI